MVRQVPVESPKQVFGGVFIFAEESEREERREKASQEKVEALSVADRK